MSAEIAQPDETIRIEDLARPIPTRPLAAAMAQAESAAPVDLSVDAVLSEARVRTALDDFGELDFIPRLQLWIDCVEEDKGLTALGRSSMYAHFVRLAANRLKVEHMLRRHPEILEVELPRPIIIAGLPRSGTTHLLNFIAADTRLRSLPVWESLDPVPDSQESGCVEDRMARARGDWDQFVAMCPLMPAMHEMEPDQVNEEIELQQLDFSTYSLDWRIRSPRWRDYYLGTDQTPHYRYLRKVLQLLTWTRGPSRWVLKCPQHMEQLGPLATAFPDAILILTHRDPVAVLRSAVTMAAYTDRLRRREVNLPSVAAYWADRVERLLRACVRDRSIFPESRSLDLRFQSFMTDEEGSIRRIYDLAGLPLTHDVEHDLRAYLARNKRGRHGRLRYDLEGDFEMAEQPLRDRFAFYYDAFKVTPETAR